ncbi:MAG: F0F1 ATP synthase subunit B [bacterium]|nr:F0F1 ATP synthase subunit B [bacterium]
MEINWAQLIGQIINIFVLVWLLNRFLYKPLLKIIDERNKKIKEGLELAKKNQQERQKIAELEKQKLAEAERRVMAIMQQAKQEAAKQAKQIIQQAQAKASQEAEKQRRLLLEELEQEKDKIKQETAELVVTVTEKILSDVLDQKQRQEIINKQLQRLKKVSW